MSQPRLNPDPSTIGGLADRLVDSPANLTCERSCILVLIEGGVRAPIVAAGLDEAMAEARRRRAAWSGTAAAQLDRRAAA